MAEYWEKTLVAELEKMGESEARTRFIRGDYGATGGLKSKFVKDWLDSKEAARKAALEIREIKRDANPIAFRALRRATWAKVIITMILIAAATIIAAIIALSQR